MYQAMPGTSLLSIAQYYIPVGLRALFRKGIENCLRTRLSQSKQSVDLAIEWSKYPYTVGTGLTGG